MNYNSYSKFKRKKNLHFLTHKPLSSIPENKELVDNSEDIYYRYFGYGLFDKNYLEELQKKIIKKKLIKFFNIFFIILLISICFLAYCHFDFCNNLVWLISYIIIAIIIFIISVILISYTCI